MGQGQPEGAQATDPKPVTPAAQRAAAGNPGSVHGGWWNLRDNLSWGQALVYGQFNVVGLASKIISCCAELGHLGSHDVDPQGA